MRSAHASRSLRTPERTDDRLASSLWTHARVVSRSACGADLASPLPDAEEGLCHYRSNTADRSATGGPSISQSKSTRLYAVASP